MGWFSVALRHDLSDVFAEHIERWQGSLIEGQSAVFRRCFKTSEFPTRTSCGGFSHQHPTLRVVIKPMFHRILPELIPSFGQNCQGCHDMVNTCQYTHKTGHDPFDTAWWFQATLWAFRSSACEVFVPSRVFHRPDPCGSARQDVQTELNISEPNGPGLLAQLR